MFMVYRFDAGAVIGGAIVRLKRFHLTALRIASGIELLYVLALALILPMTR
jgi:hypothetical protein